MKKFTDYTKDEKIDIAYDLLDFIDASPTPHHAVENLTDMMKKAGAEELPFSGKWNIKPGKVYYTCHGTAFAAFRADKSTIKKGINIAGTHTDSPCFTVKPYCEHDTLSFRRLCVEKYGGMILHGWMDRPLGIAGCVYLKTSGAPRKVLIDIDKPVIIIPGPALHIKRDINDNAKFNIQNELCPVFAQIGKGAAFGEFNSETFKEYLADEINFTENNKGKNKIKKEDILSFDLRTKDIEPSMLVGQNEEYISAPRLDDLAMTYAVFASCARVAEEKSGKQSFAAFAFDHEEIGSETDCGARSAFSVTVLQKMCEAAGLSSVETATTLADSFILSADMAHATHPAFPYATDPNNPLIMNGGPILKISANQTYFFSAEGCARFKNICNKAGVPYQEFVNNGDVAGGHTIGPMLASKYGSKCADIGGAALSMHSVREMCGTYDEAAFVALFDEFFGG